MTRHFLPTALFAGLLAVARIWMGVTVPPEHLSAVAVFKDVAHLFIGGLGIAAWIQGHKWQWWLFWGLNAIEVTVAVLSRL